MPLGAPGSSGDFPGYKIYPAPAVHAEKQQSHNERKGLKWTQRVFQMQRRCSWEPDTAVRCETSK
jgi:hypothetical protein